MNFGSSSSSIAWCTRAKDREHAVGGRALGALRLEVGAEVLVERRLLARIAQLLDRRQTPVRDALLHLENGRLRRHLDQPVGEVGDRLRHVHRDQAELVVQTLRPALELLEACR